MRTLRLALFLVCLLVVSARAYTIAPETFWFTIQDGRERIGFGRGEYESQGPGYAFKYVLVLHEKIKSGEIGIYRFDENLRPLSFTQKTLYAGQSQAVTNTFDGTFDWAKGTVSYQNHEFDVQKGDYVDTRQSLPLVKGAVSLFTTNVALAHGPLAVGKTFDYQVFSPRTKAFVTQHFDVQQRDARTGQYKIVLSSEDTPGEDRTFWFLPPTPKHQNGYITLSTFNSNGHVFRFQASTRAQALAGFEDDVKGMGL